MKENPLEELEALELKARTSGGLARAERLQDDIDRMKRIRAGVNVKYRRRREKEPRA